MASFEPIRGRSSSIYLKTLARLFLWFVKIFSTDFSTISCCDFSMIQSFWVIFCYGSISYHYVRMTLLLRIQWNNGWVPLEVIWKQFQWSVALRHRLQQKAGRRESEDRSFRKLKSRKIHLRLWLINMTHQCMGITHPPLRLTQALWTSYACTS